MLIIHPFCTIIEHNPSKYDEFILTNNYTYSPNSCNTNGFGRIMFDVFPIGILLNKNLIAFEFDLN